jgi:hypothetical protein
MQKITFQEERKELGQRKDWASTEHNLIFFKGVLFIYSNKSDQLCLQVIPQVLN